MVRLKVMLVDDEEDFTSALSERLELRGYSIMAVNNGAEALELFESDMPDIVVLDIKMPGISGIEVLKRIKSINSTIPVLLLTGYGSTEEGIKGMQLGASDYMMKPLNIDDLIKKIHASLGSVIEGE
jgi:DNA-binding response OmpR family regulator